jgi:thiosulfate dehydrogenase
MSTMSPRRLVLFGCVVGCCVCAGAACAEGTARKSTATPAAAQPGVSIAVCAACHGAAGQGVPALPESPYLAGLPAPYMERQIRAMADGTRKGAAMSAIARAMSAVEARAASRYFAALPRPTRPTQGPSASPPVLGRRLAEQGRWSQGLPACVLCHGRGGVGAGSAFPALAGQTAGYLAQQLRAFKQGARPSGPLGLMKVVAGKLSDADIQSVADYFASLSPAKPLQPLTLESLPHDDFGEVVRQGERIFEDPSRYARAYVGNRLRCSSCHLDRGRLAGSAPMWAAYVSYPAYRSKNHRVNTFAQRLQGCFRYSMNGKAPPLGDPVLVALETYSYWLAQGLRIDPHIAGRGYPKIAKPPLPPDYERGERVYGEHCALCHGPDGAGQDAADGSLAFPPLWGRGSFNWGAGMASLKNAAPFIKADMPLGLGGTLTDQQAWDVALFVDGHERPQDPRFTGSVAETRARYHDSPLSLYGRTVAGYLLGSERHDP